MESNFYTAKDLPSTTRHYPPREVPERPDINQIQAADMENGTLKPDRSHRSSKRSSVTTQITNVLSGGYPGIPWMNIHGRRMHNQ